MFINYTIATDVDPYEVVTMNEKGTRATVRPMFAERANQEKDHFSPGGFCGHTSHPDGQKWIFKSNPDGEVRKMSKRKDGRWRFVGDAGCRTGCSGRLSEEPYKHYDYNF